MWKDPVVTEVRRAGEKLAKRANNNLHTFFKNLRKAGEEYQAQISYKAKTHKPGVRRITSHA